MPELTYQRLEGTDLYVSKGYHLDRGGFKGKTFHIGHPGNRMMKDGSQRVRIALYFIDHPEQEVFLKDLVSGLGLTNAYNDTKSVRVDFASSVFFDLITSRKGKGLAYFLRKLNPSSEDLERIKSLDEELGIKVVSRDEF